MKELLDRNKKGEVSGSRGERGLSQAEVERSRAQYGSNALTGKKRKSFFLKFLSNLGDPVIKILIGALIVNLVFMSGRADWVESLGIGVSILLATLISTLSEHTSEAAFARLRESASGATVRAVRDGEIRRITIDEVVVGDVLLVGAGEQIAADGELISGEISVDQSSMTGESREVRKRGKTAKDIKDELPSSPYFCLRGCLVLSGSGEMRVCRVGDATFLGGISAEIQTETRQSPLTIRLKKLAKQISVLGYVLAALVAVVYLFSTFVIDSAFDADIILYKLTSWDFLLSHLLHALTVGLTVLVVAVPEGLPMMIAVVLSSNIKKMVRDNVLVLKPVGIEAAGSMNILFTDKTGTLTEGKMSLGGIYLGDGVSYSSMSALRSAGGVYEALVLSSYANTSSARDASGNASGGNATDRALLSAVLCQRERKPHFDTVWKREFDSNVKYSAACIDIGGKRRVLIKGAPEVLLPRVARYLDRSGREKELCGSVFDELCHKLTAQGKRILLIAQSAREMSCAEAERGAFGELCMVCLVALEDKIRKEARSSVETLQRAGVQVVMITGDNKETAQSIAARCGIIRGKVNRVLTSAELSRLTDGELARLLPQLAVVARALPGDKSRLVRVSQELEKVVGMTGDGINDAPALKRADVGFSMGDGTDVAKDAGDIIILDNNLSSITRAVLYGRTVFKSIRKFISLQLTMNLCAVGVSIICPFLGYDAPVTVVQMLWINIIMDTLGGLAFAGEAPLMSYMDEAPKRRDEPILCGYMIYEILLQGGFTIALCLSLLKAPEISAHYRFSSDNIYILTAFFALFIFASVFNCFCARTDRLNGLSNLSKNKPFIVIMAAVLFIQILFVYLGGSVLRTAPLTARELMITAALALCVIPFDFVRKLIWRLFAGKRGILEQLPLTKTFGFDRI
ncbi:MAG: calcium-translocating P-type ATPase, PMCA-type [Clostridia bacterium]|nr:calcium-translocating P-type ATPase, PMCA-type [Clostridia bacterium]